MRNRGERLRSAFVELLVAEMAKQQISDRELSERLEKNKNFINDIRHGQHVVKFHEFVEIAEELGKSPLDWLSRCLHA
jgi:ribosome-binding protein aMBF1 (putative translation factor)